MGIQAEKEFLIRVKADVQKAVDELRGLSDTLKKQKDDTDGAKDHYDGLSGALGALTSAVGAYVSVQTAVKALRMADEYQSIQIRIERATRSQGDYNKVSDELYQIAQRNGAALKETADLFIGINRAGEELHATRNQVLSVTQAVQQLGIMSGASHVELRNSLRQFSQAMAGGVVRAEEFNSIIENTPEIAARIAKGMGKTVGQLRLAVVEGKVLSRDVFGSLLKQAPEIADEMADVPERLDQSFAKLNNSAMRFVAALNEATGVLGFITKQIDDVTELIDRSAKNGGLNLLELFSAPPGTQERLDAMYQRYAELEAIAAQLKAEAAGEGSFWTRMLVRTPEQAAEKLEQVNRQLRELEKSIWGAWPNNESTDPGELPPAPDQLSPEAEREAKQRETAIRRIIDALQEQADTYGNTSEQIAIYRLRQQGATDADIARAQALMASIAADREFEEAVRASEQAVKDENAAYQDWVQGQQEYLQTVIASVDKTYEFAQELERLETLMAMFPEHADMIHEAMLNVHEAMDNVGDKTAETGTDMDQFAIQAARNIQSAFADFLFDPFSSGLDGMLTGFVRMLHRMVAEVLAQQILKSFFTSMAGMGGGAGGFFASMAAGIHHTGGLVGTGPTRMVSPLAFATAPRYHTGGLAGFKPTEMPAVLERNEEVLPTSDPRHRFNGGGAAPIIKVVNTIDSGSFVSEGLSTVSGEQALMNAIRANASTIKQALG